MTSLPLVTRAVPRIRPRLVDEPGIRLGLAEAALVLTALSAAALRLPASDALVLMACAAFAGGDRLPVSWAVGLGLSAWAFYTGFLENTLGQLTFSGTDDGRLALMVLVAVAGSLLTAARVRRG